VFKDCPEEDLLHAAQITCHNIQYVAALLFEFTDLFVGPPLFASECPIPTSNCFNSGQSDGVPGFFEVN
jgi:hypothetical protein